MNAVLIFVGGGLGSLARYGLSRATGQWLGASFPWGTLAVNSAACLLLGFVAGLSMDRFLVSPGTRLFLAVGFCGGFSTFSTFTYETLELVRLGQYAYATVNILSSLLVCAVALVAGAAAARWMP